MAATRTVSGTIRIFVAPRDPVEGEEVAELVGIVENFCRAVRLEMFKGSLGVVGPCSQSDEGAVSIEFDARDVELGAFRVLHGMLSYYSMMVRPLGAFMAWREPQGSSANLLTPKAPMPVLAQRIPFALDIGVGRGAAPPVVVEVVLARALNEQDKDRLDQELRVWWALVNGGYPRAGDPPGCSAMGPCTIRYDDSQTLRMNADAFLASDDCFVSLQALLLHWSRDIPVVSLEVE